MSRVLGWPYVLPYAMLAPGSWERVGLHSTPTPYLSTLALHLIANTENHQECTGAEHADKRSTKGSLPVIFARPRPDGFCQLGSSIFLSPTSAYHCSSTSRFLAYL